MVRTHITQIQTLNITKDGSFHIPSTKDENFWTDFRGCVPTSSFRLLSSSLNFYPSIVHDVEKIDIIENSSWNTTTYYTEMLFIDFCGWVSSSCSWDFSWNRRKYPTLCINIKNEKIVKELVWITSTKHVEWMIMIKI